jgi:hypothetical protein
LGDFGLTRSGPCRGAFEPGVRHGASQRRAAPPMRRNSRSCIQHACTSLRSTARVQRRHRWRRRRRTFHAARRVHAPPSVPLCTDAPGPDWPGRVRPAVWSGHPGPNKGDRPGCPRASLSRGGGLTRKRMQPAAGRTADHRPVAVEAGGGRVSHGARGMSGRECAMSRRTACGRHRVRGRKKNGKERYWKRGRKRGK